MSIAPPNAMEIRVNAKQWSWEFVYPNGGSSDKLHVPVHKPVKLVMASADVLHSFFIPALRVKRDVVPGMYTSLWFEATHIGKDDIMPAPSTAADEARGPAANCRISRATIRTTRTWPADDGPLGDALDACTSRARRTSTSSSRASATSATRSRSQGKPCPGERRWLPRARSSTSRRGAWRATRRRARASSARPGRASGARRSRPTTDRSLVDENYVRESILAPAGQDRHRLPAVDADLQRPDLRPGDRRAHRLHQVAQGHRPGPQQERAAWQQSTSLWSPGGHAEDAHGDPHANYLKAQHGIGRGSSRSTTSASA
jgi:hypothetical protein